MSELSVAKCQHCWRKRCNFVFLWGFPNSPSKLIAKRLLSSISDSIDYYNACFKLPSTKLLPHQLPAVTSPQILEIL